MRRNMVWGMFALLFLLGVSFSFEHSISANSTSVAITPNQSENTVSVTVSDAGLNGKEVSVVCYDPSLSGSVNDLTGNKKSIVYMNQYTVNGTASFTFRVKKQLVQGLYTLVVTSEKGQIIKQFRCIPEEVKNSPTPTDGSKKAAEKKTTKKKVLKAPAGVKVKAIAKRKIRVTWKKVKGAKGYIISTSTKKKGKYKTKLTVKGGSKKKTILKKMKSGKVYYVKVKAYQLSGKKKVAGKLSKAKKVKVR